MIPKSTARYWTLKVQYAVSALRWNCPLCMKISSIIWPLIKIRPTLPELSEWPCVNTSSQTSVSRDLSSVASPQRVRTLLSLSGEKHVVVSSEKVCSLLLLVCTPVEVSEPTLNASHEIMYSPLMLCLLSRCAVSPCIIWVGLQSAAGVPSWTGLQAPFNLSPL